MLKHVLDSREAFAEVLLREHLEVAFFQVGRSNRFPPGFVHEKVVPFGIAARAIQGRYEIACGGSSAMVTGDAAFLTPAGLPLRIVHHHADGGFAAHWIHFSFVLYQTIDITSLLELPLAIGVEHGRLIGALIDELERGLKGPPDHGAPLSALARAGREREIAWQLFRLLCEVASLRPWAMDSLEAGRRLQPLLQHLDTHLGEPIDIPMMAALARMSMSRLFVYFRDRLGTTPMSYVSQLRLKKAASLFSQWDQPSVKEVAAATGFANASHLSREFRRRYGVSPRKFREREVFRALTPAPP